VKPSVTVVIPTTNRASLVETLKSVTCQTFRSFRAIIVDDSAQQMVKFEDLQVIQTGGMKGVSYARNMGMNAADTKYIALLDDDDKWHFNFLKKQLWNLEQFQFDFGITGAIVNGKKRPKKPLYVGVNPFHLLYNRPHLLWSEGYLPTSSYFFRSEIRDRIQFDENLIDRENLKFVKDCFDSGLKIHQDVANLVTINYNSRKSIARMQLKQEIDWFYYLRSLNPDWADNFLIETSRNFIRNGDSENAKRLIHYIQPNRKFVYKVLLNLLAI